MSEQQKDARDGMELIGDLFAVIDKIQKFGMGIGAVQEPNGKFDIVINTDRPGVFVEACKGKDISFLHPENDDENDAPEKQWEVLLLNAFDDALEMDQLLQMKIVYNHHTDWVVSIRGQSEKRPGYTSKIVNAQDMTRELACCNAYQQLNKYMNSKQSTY